MTLTVSALIRGSIISLGLIASPPTLRADEDAALLARVQAAETATSIDAAGLKPWHMKAAVQLFDSHGKLTDEGTIEEWWSAASDRTEYKFGTYSATEVRTSNKLFRTKGLDLPPYYPELLRDEIVHPVRMPEPSKPHFPVLRKPTVSKTPLECVAIKDRQDESPAETLNYCFGSKPDGLWIVTNFGHQAIMREAIGNFQGHQVSVKTAVAYNGITMATSKVESLSAVTETDVHFQGSEDLQEVSPPLLKRGQLAELAVGTSPKAASQPQPSYPELAKKEHLAGSVLFRAVIGTNGSIRKLEPVGATDPIFVDASKAAVKKWTYKPALWNGQPVELETEISVNFAFGPL